MGAVGHEWLFDIHILWEWNLTISRGNSVYMSFYQYSIIGLAHQTKDKYWFIDSQSTAMAMKPLPKLTSMVTVGDIIGPSKHLMC